MFVQAVKNRFASTLLVFHLDDEALVVDLRRPVSDETRQDLSNLGPTNCFAVVTAANPKGRQQSVAENAAAHRALKRVVAGIGAIVRPADGVSPDGTHREAGLAVWVSEPEARSIAQHFDQLAYFWFDSHCFWLIYCDDGARVPLPMT